MSTIETARQYAEDGFAVIPVPRGQKSPILKGWNQLRITAGDVSQHFSSDSNIALLNGEASRGIVNVDLDSVEALPIAEYFLPPTGRIHGRHSKAGSHWWYRCADRVPESRKFTDPTTTNGKSVCLLELISNNRPTLIPPSIHPLGEPYKWEKNGKPAQADAAALTATVEKLAAATLLARHWREGARHECAMAISGILLRAGWTEEEAKNFVNAVATAANDEERKTRVLDVSTTAKRLAEGQNVIGAPRLKSLINPIVVDRVLEWLHIHPLSNAESSVPNSIESWPDPQRLAESLPPVELLNPLLLPKSFRPLIEDVADRMQAPPDFAACAVIVALAGCVNRRARVVPKQHDSTWSIVPKLWGACIAPPGFMKSPTLRTITQPLSKVEDAWREEFSQASHDYEIEQEKIGLKIQAWKEEFKRAEKKGIPAPPRPELEVQPPTQNRLLVQDPTYEKLHEILAENPAGVILLRDELTGWLSGLERQGREQERAFYLECWNGDSGFTIDRIGRGSIHVPAACVSLFGNIQPARLRYYLSDVLAGGAGDDGLVQRFQVLVWPDPPRDWRYVDRPPNGLAAKIAEDCLSALVKLSPDRPVNLRFDPDAQQLFCEWLTILEGKVRSEYGLSVPMVGHLSKYRSLMPTIAGLFELADSFASGSIAADMFISLDHARQAAAMCSYLESHAKRVYSCIESQQQRSAKELAKKIQARDVPSTFKARDVYLKGWTALSDPQDVRNAIEVLGDLGWVITVETPSTKTGGAPSKDVIVNPKVYQP